MLARLHKTSSNFTVNVFIAVTEIIQHNQCTHVLSSGGLNIMGYNMYLPRCCTFPTQTGIILVYTERMK